MNTYKTLRGIEFDLEVIEINNNTVEVMATCEEGSKSFEIEFDLPIEEDWSLYRNLEDGKTDDLVDMLGEVNEWVDSVTIAFIASEAAKLCVANSNETEYWQFSMFYSKCVTLQITVMVVEDGLITCSSGSHYANGETEIKELINKLK